MSTPEGRVKDKVRKALNSLPSHYRFMPVQNGMGAPGLDFFCCIESMFVAIETKVEGKKLTDRQRETARKIAEAGGLVFVIRNDGDIIHMLQTISFWASQHNGSPAGVVYDRCP